MSSVPASTAASSPLPSSKSDAEVEVSKLERVDIYEDEFLTILVVGLLVGT